MFTVHYNHRSGGFSEREFDEFEDVRNYIVENIKNFLMNDAYAVHFELDFNRVQVWDDESEILEYKWFTNS